MGGGPAAWTTLGVITKAVIPKPAGLRVLPRAHFVVHPWCVCPLPLVAVGCWVHVLAACAKEDASRGGALARLLSNVEAVVGIAVGGSQWGAIRRASRWPYGKK